MNKIVILVGAPKAGKSLLSGALYHLLNRMGESFFLERLAPDQEGIWTWDSGRLDLARRLKNELKRAGEFFSPAFVAFKCSAIKGLASRFKYLLLDLGGVPSEENARFIQTAIETGNEIVVLLLHSGAGGTEEWEKFLEEFGLKPIKIRTNWDLEGDLKQQAMELAEKVFKTYIK